MELLKQYMEEISKREETEAIIRFAEDIQAGELARQRGELDVESMRDRFGTDAVTKVGQQRLDAAVYLTTIGYRKRIDTIDEIFAAIYVSCLKHCDCLKREDVEALMQVFGSRVATVEQIRDMMMRAAMIEASKQ